MPASLVLFVKVLTGGNENELDSWVNATDCCVSIMEGEATREEINGLVWLAVKPSFH